MYEFYEAAKIHSQVVKRLETLLEFVLDRPGFEDLEAYREQFDRFRSTAVSPYEVIFFASGEKQFKFRGSIYGSAHHASLDVTRQMLGELDSTISTGNYFFPLSGEEITFDNVQEVDVILKSIPVEELEELLAEVKIEGLACGASYTPSEIRKKTANNCANTPRLFRGKVPLDNVNLLKLICLLDHHAGSGKSDREVAREITGEMKGTEPRAMSLLTQVARLKREGQIIL